MAQWPRRYRAQIYRQQLKDVLTNPYADASQVAAANKAVQQKLDQDDREYARLQANLTQQYLNKLGGKQ